MPTPSEWSSLASAGLANAFDEYETWTFE